MMGLTPRDKKCYDFIIETGLPFTIRQLSLIFYNQSRNEKSSYTICSRRISMMVKGEYLQKMSGTKFGSETLIYANKKLSKQVRHQLCVSEFLTQLATNGFEIISCKCEKEFKEFGIRSDAFIEMVYNKTHYYVVLEVNLNTNFNPKYDEFVKAIVDGKYRFNHQVIFVNVSDHAFNQDEYQYVKPVCLKTDFRDFSKFQYLFIR